jgi:hypothetical protein
MKNMLLSDDLADSSRSQLAQKLNILDLVVVCTVLTIFLIRVFLKITNYPMLGGGGLHIAHMLWGGLAMFVMLLYLLLSNRPMRYVAASISGVGFGLYIDEIGKFVTSDNNYFYKPAAFLMYLILVTTWTVARFWVVRAYRGSFLSSAEWPRRRVMRLAIVLYSVIHIIAGFTVVASVVVRGANVFDFPTSLRDYLAAIIMIVTLLFLIGVVQYRRHKLELAAHTTRLASLLTVVAIYPYTFYRQQFVAAVGCFVTILVVIGLSGVSVRGLFSAIWRVA